MIDKDHSFKRMTAIMSLGEGESIEVVAEALHDAGFDIYQPKLGLATTEHLLDELTARNVGGQRSKYPKTMEQAAGDILKIRRAFANRDGGLTYRTVDS